MAAVRIDWDDETPARTVRLLSRMSCYVLLGVVGCSGSALPVQEVTDAENTQILNWAVCGPFNIDAKESSEADASTGSLRPEARRLLGQTEERMDDADFVQRCRQRSELRPPDESFRS